MSSSQLWEHSVLSHSASNISLGVSGQSYCLHLNPDSVETLDFVWLLLGPMNYNQLVLLKGLLKRLPSGQINKSHSAVQWAFQPGIATF